MGNKKGRSSPYRYDDLYSEIPSEIGDDQWGEIPRYQYQKHLEALNKEKQDKIDKKGGIKGIYVTFMQHTSNITAKRVKLVGKCKYLPIFCIS